jgi:hypothetical protein
VSDLSSLPDKLQGYREAVYRDTFRENNRQVYQEVYREVDQDSTEVTYRERPMKSTGWSGKRTLKDDYRIQRNLQINRLMLNTDDYWLQDILYRACGSTAQSSDSASEFELGKYNHRGKAYV